MFINNNNEVYSTKEGKIKIWGQTFFIPSSSVYKGLSFESFDPKNQRIMRELEKESGERGTIWKTFGREGGDWELKDCEI